MPGFTYIESFKTLFILVLFTAAGCNTVDTGVSVPYPDCYDNIQNQNEQGVDCGGPCAPCQGKVTAYVDGVPWSSDGNVSSSINNNSIIILSGNGTSTISFIHTGPFVTGTFSLQSALYSISASGTNYLSNQGSITFTKWDEVAEQVSGTFNFIAVESSGTGDTVKVNGGKFEFVPYQP